ncbi:MAG: Shedu immune nuclease family protein, partial [Candidatus Gracilibacteria bacterium]
STKTGKNKGPEDVWQNFFENNPWIFGYGLNYIWCHKVNIDEKLEQVVVGTDFSEPGKRIDALLKTAGRLKQFVIVEIKRADTPLMGNEYRPNSWEAAKDLRGGIAQVQKTTSKLREKYFIKYESKDAEGYLADAIYNFTPKSYLVIGNLRQFLNEEEKLHEEKYASFEIFRNSINNPEIITFDELYERARFIVEHSEK